MLYSKTIIYSLEIIGTIAFAFSGAMLGIKRKMDILGVIVLGITTAVGGGLIRDVILDKTPPNMFVHPSYTLISILVSMIVFFLVYKRKDVIFDKYKHKYEKILITMDNLGLSAFTVLGINTAIDLKYEGNYFLMIFVGVITGVGGGLLRDIMAGVKPYIFVRHVYATASIAGAIVTVIFFNLYGKSVGMVSGAITVLIIRYFAIKYDWNLPKIV
ncbi:trimeric intracellular cation channel family protein [Fusobacterium sp. PH5-44]|uniref:trimeric intracellular cation channel family protein n=1 Tax=unclassified Fusobacterium TaxID=2648384 RepID=UPI003D1C576A